MRSGSQSGWPAGRRTYRSYVWNSRPRQPGVIPGVSSTEIIPDGTSSPFRLRKWLDPLSMAGHWNQVRLAPMFLTIMWCQWPAKRMSASPTCCLPSACLARSRQPPEFAARLCLEHFRFTPQLHALVETHQLGIGITMVKSQPVLPGLAMTE